VSYRRNVVVDRDNVLMPKEEVVEKWDTPDFFEFERVFKCTKSEFIYLVKGIGYEKQFNISIKATSFTRTYHLLTFKCGDTYNHLKTK